MDERARLGPEELLAHLEWMRRLACALVADGDDARDLAQEGVAVALAHPPGTDRPVRPWLAGVLRNLARLRARGAGRRARRETASLTEDQLAPSPETLVARVETERRLAAMVLALGEPFRTTLLLRYYEGRSAADIARLQNLPAGTVRWRLKHGLDRLRGELDRTHGGRRHWSGLLGVPPAVPTKQAPSTRSGRGGSLPAADRPTAFISSSFAGVALMSLQTKIGLSVVLLLVLLAGAARWSGVWTPAGNRNNPQSASRPTLAPRTLRFAVHTGGVQISAAPDDPAGSLRLQGQVIDTAEVPLVGAQVAIDTSPPRVATADANGAFVFAGLPSRTFTLEAQFGALFAGPVHTRPATTGEPVVLRARPATTLDVEVRSAPEGRPISGATVELRSLLVRRAGTDASGVARLAGVGPGWRPLRVEAAGFAPAAQMLVVGSAPVQRLTVRLAAGAPVTGRVLAPDGKPVAAARVWARSSSEPFAAMAPELDSVESDGSGGWRLPALAPGSYQFAASHSDYAPAVSPPTVVGRVPLNGVEMRLAAAGRLGGVVHDGDGRPLARVQVRAAALSRTLPGWSSAREAFTTDDGRFLLTGLPRRSVQVVALADDAASPMASADLATAASAEVTLVLSIRRTLEGIVVDGRGRPVPEAQVMATPVKSGRGLDWELRGLPMLVSDAGGRFHIAGLPDGEYELRAVPPDRAPEAMNLQQVTVAHAGDREVRVVVRGEGIVAGQVALEDGALPGSFSVSAGAGDPVPFTGGAFALSATAGIHELTVAGPTFVTAHVDNVRVEENARTDVGTVKVRGGRVLTGRVLGPDGAPVAQAQVVAGRHISGGGTQLMIPTESLAFQETVSGDDGQFRLAGLSELPLVVVAQHDDVGRSVTVPVAAGPPVVAIDLRLAPVGSLAGTITRDGRPFADTVVIATPQLGRSNFFVVTGADGRYAFDRLASGAYQLVVFLGRSKDQLMRPIEVKAGRRAQADVDVRTGNATLTIRVETDQRTPANALVMLISGVHRFSPAATIEGLLDELRPGEPTVAFVRDARGNPAVFEGLLPGAYTACAAAVPRGSQRIAESGVGGGLVRCVTRELSSDGALGIILTPAPP